MVQIYLRLLKLIMKNQNDKELSSCIISWGMFALNIKTERPKNNKKCSLEYWHDVINTILANSKYNQYAANRQNAIDNFDFVSHL